MAARVAARMQPAEIAPFSALRNRRILMPDHDPALLVIEKGFAAELLAPVISTIFVDEKWYRERNPDIVEALNSGQFKSAKDHYVRHGFFEHRLPYPITVTEDWYLAQYPDVRAAVQREDFRSAQHHFELAGYREGRLPYANFFLRSA